MSKTRLICPNCGAQYEVPAEVIPEAGRDVQCSNCGHTWFQNHPDHDTALAEELNQAVPDESWAPEPEVEQTPPPPPPAAEPQRRELDPSVADVLREEAELEAKAREAEANALESQPDLGLADPNEDEQARRARQARDRMARIRGTEPEAAPQPETEGRAAAEAAAAAAGSRRELLPNVEEINQTLRSSSEPRAVDEVERASVDAPPRRSGFARGFFLIVLLVLIALAIYISAPQIKAQVPAAGPYLDSYVALVDQGRAWLDGQIGSLTSTLDGMSSEAAPSEPAAEDSN